MNDAHRHFEIRCPVHGFIEINDWERAVIDSPPFQRLRRIRQLAWTEFVYPGATHARFEHSLGVMHVATRIYDALRKRETETLTQEFAYNDVGFERDRQLFRFAALLHDVGHGPLSHASEELMPKSPSGAAFTHEQYSAAIIRGPLREAIESHPLNDNCGLRADDVADFLEGKAKARRTLFWREALIGQIEADRMDYLLRDAYHAGVAYGHFDLNRVIATLTVAPGTEDTGARLALTAGGLHAGESIVLARYFMFSQVYFHKTRVAFDLILRRLLPKILPGGVFPPPSAEGLQEFLKWDDWRVLAEITAGRCGDEGEMLLKRNHFRPVYETPQISNSADLERLERVKRALGGLLVSEETPTKSWYKIGTNDIPIVGWDRQVRPLSEHSAVVASMKTTNKSILYVRPSDVRRANEIIEKAACAS